MTLVLTLATWEQRDFWPGSEAGPDANCNQDVYERQIGTEAPGPPDENGLFRRTAREIAGLRLFFAARGEEVFDGKDGPLWRTGFRYRTLVGHPEYGAETVQTTRVRRSEKPPMVLSV